MNDQFIAAIKAELMEQLNVTHELSDEQLRQFIEKMVFQRASTIAITANQKIELIERLFHSLRGLDILQPLLHDPSISEIMINDYNRIFVERNGEMSQLAITFANREKLEDVIQTIVASVNRVVNESTPIVDARLKDGSRVHIVLPPISLTGPTVTIRKFPSEPLQMEQLIAKGTISAEAASLLQTLVRAKYNIFLSGGTGSGKTTFLNALSAFIPADERVVTIEDAAELQITTVPNVVALETRNANTEGRGELTIRDLIRASLRMRPSRIIVGEVRGQEAADMLQALNTGHAGSSSGHAGSAQDMMTRLEAMAQSGSDLSSDVIRRQIYSAIDIVVHMDRMRDHSRKVTEICEVTQVNRDGIGLQSLYKYVETSSADGSFSGQLVAMGHTLQRTWKLQMAGTHI